MKSTFRISPLLRRCLLGATGLMLLLAAPSLFGQSCALCYTQAAASTARFIQALRSGILILVIPPTVLSVGITVLTYRRRNDFHSPR
ncbi:MAG: hypothetical protein WCC87_22395 [Candidatus Korobacteraceae bacterium]